MLSKSFFAMLLAVTAGGWAGTHRASAQAEDEPGGRIRIGAATASLSGRVQTQFNTTSIAGEPEMQWMIRRARFELQVKANEVVGGKIQPDFSGDRFTLKDAYVSLDLSPALQVIAGHTHRPFGILTRFSSLRMPTIEKGAEIRGTRAWDQVNLVKDLGYANRDVGLHLAGAPEGAPLGLEYEVALVQGPDGNRITEGTMPQVVSRLALSPLGGVTVGGSWSRRPFASADSGSAPQEVRTGSAVALDLAITSPTPGLLLLAEVTSGDFDPWADAVFRGANLWVAYDFVPSSGPVTMIEPMLRISRGELRNAPSSSGGTLLTPGFNVYLGGLNRVMLNYDLWDAAGDRPVERSLKVMFQLAF